MKFFKKLIDFFRRTKEIAASVELNTRAYIKLHSQQIKLIMSILEALFPVQAGLAKMNCLVKIVCSAIGLDDVSPQVAEFVTAELQKQYEEFKKELNK